MQHAVVIDYLVYHARPGQQTGQRDTVVSQQVEGACRDQTRRQALQGIPEQIVARGPGVYAITHKSPDVIVHRRVRESDVVVSVEPAAG